MIATSQFALQVWIVTQCSHADYLACVAIEPVRKAFQCEHGVRFVREGFPICRKGSNNRYPSLPGFAPERNLAKNAECARPGRCDTRERPTSLSASPAFRRAWKQLGVRLPVAHRIIRQARVFLRGREDCKTFRVESQLVSFSDSGRARGKGFPPWPANRARSYPARHDSNFPERSFR